MNYTSKYLGRDTEHLRPPREKRPKQKVEERRRKRAELKALRAELFRYKRDQK